MFSILKKIFANISGKTEKQVLQKKDSQASYIHLKRQNKFKSEKKNIPEEEKSHKETPQRCASQKTVSQVQENETSRPGHSGKKNRKGSGRAVNRHGIPVYEKHTDLSKYFSEKTENREISLPEKRECRTESLAIEKPNRVRIKKQSPAKSNARRGCSVPRNRHGIPLFREDDDFSRYFRDEHSGEMYRRTPDRRGRFPEHSPHHASLHSNDAADDFQTLLNQSLAESGMEEMLKKKFGGLPSEHPIPLRKKLAAYPPPQEIMDLHGCTADQAEEKTEDFIRRARHRGMRTLLIIVGKGLHSEGRAVLPDVVENRVLVLKQKNWVLAYEWEKKIQRKSGALIVYLNESD